MIHNCCPDLQERREAAAQEKQRLIDGEILKQKTVSKSVTIAAVGKPAGENKPTWYEAKQRIDAMRQLHGMKKDDATKIVHAEMHEERRRAAESGVVKRVKERERIAPDLTPWLPSKYEQFDAFLGRRSKMTVDDHRRYVAMLLQLTNFGVLRFTDQSVEYKVDGL